MKMTFLVATALSTLTGVAVAADLPSRRAPLPYVAVPVFTWTGFYAGVNAGYVFDADTRFDGTTGQLPNNTASLATGLRPVSARVRSDGFTGGGQIGYNYQFGAGSGVVIGLEADAAYTDLDRTRTFVNTTNLGPLVTPSPGLFTRANQFRSELDFLGTVRGRLGYAFGNVLFFGTGGFAYGNARNSAVFFAPNSGTPFFVGGDERLKTGYAYGGGMEYAIPIDSFFNRLNPLSYVGLTSQAATLKVEYLHYELERDRLPIGSVNGGPGSYTTRFRNTGDLVRVGLNYKFDLF